MGLNELELSYWNNYLDTLPVNNIPSDSVVSASLAGDLSLTDDLIGLYLSGKKTAGSSVVEDFEVAGDPLPKVGNYWIVLDSKKVPSLILKTARTETFKWSDVPESVAVAEGEGDLSLEYWKSSHANYFGPFLDAWNIKNLNDAHVITEFFEVVWGESNGLYV